VTEHKDVCQKTTDAKKMIRPGSKRKSWGFSGTVGFFGIARDDIARGIHQSCHVTTVVPDGCFLVPEGTTVLVQFKY
jgi:hypothetical protein